MQAKLLILFVLVGGLIVTCTEGFGQPVGQAPIGRKREFEKIHQDLCRAARQIQCNDLEDEAGMKEMPGYNR